MHNSKKQSSAVKTNGVSWHTSHQKYVHVNVATQWIRESLKTQVGSKCWYGTTLPSSDDASKSGMPFHTTKMLPWLST